MDSPAAGLTRESPRPQPFPSASLGSGAAPSPCSVSLAHTRGQFSHGMGSAGLKKPSLSQDDEGLPPPAVLSSETPVAPAPAPRPAALLHVSACSTEAVPGLRSRQSLPECHWQQHVFNDRTPSGQASLQMPSISFHPKHAAEFPLGVFLGLR